MNKLLSIALVAILTAMAAGCDSGLKWNVNGSIEGADSKTMILQASDNGRWYTLDSITTDKTEISNIPTTRSDIPTYSASYSTARAYISLSTAWKQSISHRQPTLLTPTTSCQVPPPPKCLWLSTIASAIRHRS